MRSVPSEVRSRYEAGLRRLFPASRLRARCLKCGMEETRLDCAGYPCRYCMEANSGTWDGLVSLHLREREEWGPGWRRLEEGDWLFRAWVVA